MSVDQLDGMPADPGPPRSPWLTARGAAEWAQCGVKTIYREARAGRLRAAQVGGRRELRFRAEWIDEWLTAASRRAVGPGEVH